MTQNPLYQCGWPPINIDWPLFQQQRDWLCEQAQHAEEAAGLLHLTDAIADLWEANGWILTPTEESNDEPTA